MLFSFFIIVLLIFQTHPAFEATLTSGDIGPNYAHRAIKDNNASLNINGSSYWGCL